MARHISTNYRLKSSILKAGIITSKTTANTSNKTATTTPQKTNTTNTSNISNDNYNEILSKLNDYALKTSLSEFITQQDLNSAISTIKQCNCETQPINTDSVDNDALNALIQKLNNYGIFNYDVPGKETIVTEFFPHLIQKNGVTIDSYSDGFMEMSINTSIEIGLLLLETENTNLDIFDFIIIPADNNKTVNQSAYKSYFSKATQQYADDKGNKPFCIVSKEILNTPLIEETSSTIKTLNLIFDGENFYTQVSNVSSSATEGLSSGEIPIPIEFTVIQSTADTKNGIKCEFRGISPGTGGNGITGEIKLTMPENITISNQPLNTHTNSWSLTATNNIIILTNNHFDSMLGTELLEKQIIIAESTTKRYVIKLDGIAYNYPPGY